MLSISKQFEWDMGHRIPNHDSLCKNPHGHRYQMDVGVTGTVNTDRGTSQEGMIVDFGPLKRLVVAQVVEPLDHSFMYYEEDEVMAAFAKANPDLRLHAMPFIPTAECIVTHLAEKMQAALANTLPDVALEHVQLFETPTSSALWTPDQA
jgi:6-pyruvoyltetrahydropterin/6-carboxytetrahydropterin synthase